jgi:hypothetical protein
MMAIKSPESTVGVREEEEEEVPHILLVYCYRGR